MIMLGILIWGLLMAAGYVSHADLDDNQKTMFYVVAIVGVIILFVLTAILS